MASQRLLVTLLLISIVATIHAAKKNDLIVGARIPGDYLIQKDTAKKSSSFLQIVKLKKTLTGDNHSKITQLRLLDQNTNGHGATAAIIAGGIGYNFVTVEFKSERGHSIDFIVELYGRI